MPDRLIARIVFRHYGRTEYGHWLDRASVWDMLYHHSVLLDGEWIGIEEQGQDVQVYKRGPWINKTCLTGSPTR